MKRFLSVVLSLSLFVTPVMAANTVTSYFPAVDYNNSPNSRQGQISSDGNFVYFFSFQDFAGNAHLNKASLSSTTVTSGDDVAAGPDIHFAPVGGYSSGTKLWIQGLDTATSAVPSMFSFDKTTLSLVDEIAVGSDEGAFGGYKAITSDGGIFAGINGPGTGIFLFNTSTSQHAQYLFSVNGGPADNSIAGLQFDSSNNLWTYDDTGKFWYWPVTLVGGVPTLGIGTSVTTTGTHSTGLLDYNPITNIITSWIPGSSSIQTVPINATTRIVGTIHSFSNTPSPTSPIDLGMAQAHSWGISDYVGVLNKGGLPDNNPIIPGIYQRSTNTVTYYTWASFSGTEPTDVAFSIETVSSDGSSIVGIDGGVIPDDTDNQNWLFQFGSSPPSGSCVGFLPILGIGC